MGWNVTAQYNLRLEFKTCLFERAFSTCIDGNLSRLPFSIILGTMHRTIYILFKIHLVNFEEGGKKSIFPKPKFISLGQVLNYTRSNTKSHPTSGKIPSLKAVD